MARFTGGGGGAGTPGAGYEFSWTPDFDLPQNPYIPGNSIEILGRVGKAYTVGNYVRYYYDRVNNPDVWIEGKITQVIFADFQDSITIFVETQGSATQGFLASSTTTVNSELMLAGKSGADGAGYSFEVPDGRVPSSGVNFPFVSYGTSLGFNGLLGEAFGPEGQSYDFGPYVRVTFSSGDWVEGLLGAINRDISWCGFELFVEKWKGVNDLSLASAEITSVAVVARNATDADGILGYSSSLSNLDPATIVPGTTVAFTGNTEAYSVDDYIRFSIDADNWLEGVVWSINEGVYGQYGGLISVVINSWNITEVISQTFPNIFVEYPDAKISIVAPAGAGYSGGPALATATNSSQNPTPQPINLLMASVGDTYIYAGEIGAYRVGDYVKLSYVDAPEWDADALTAPVGISTTWFEGTITSISPAGTNSYIEVTIEDFYAPQEFIDANGGDWNWWSIGLAGKPGADGEGYDVTVDTYASYIEIQKLLASDSENFSKFGNAVSISGDGKTMVVSAPTEDTSPNSDNGAVYVFTRSGTSWVEQAKLIASDANSMRLFGTSISISEDGNTIVVGTPRFDFYFNVYDGGVAYIFTRSGTTWTEQAKLIANDMTVYDYFGESVSISGNGNTVIVGAYNKNANMFSQNTGVAYIFTRSGSTWTEQEKLVASDPEWYDYFGKAVAISADGSTAFIQAANEDTSPNNDNGAVYVFTNSGTSWTEQAKLLASDAASYENFGNSISASEEGNTVVIGSMYKTTTPNDQNGAVYVFTRSGSTWNEEAKLIASDTESYERFGSSVSISADGDTIVVGADAENTAPSYGNGAAYIFTRSSSTWTQQAKLLASNLDSSDTFGRSVSISADKSTVIVGSVFGEPNDTGSIYVFNLNLTWDPAVFSIGAYLGNSYVKAISSPSTYAEGILNTSESGSYSILVESASGSFDLDALNTVSLSIAGVPGITGANGADGTNGIDGTDGAGYDYVMPENFGGPGIELEPAGTSITLNTYVGSGDFGAYVVGNYVRYYPNPEAEPFAWVEGEITSRTTDFYESLTILIDNWSPQAPGIIGASFDATIRPYMTATGKSGINYIPQFSVGSVTTAAPGNPPSVIMRAPSFSSTGPNTITINYVLDFDLPG